MRFAIITIAFGLLITARAQAAENVYLSLQSNGVPIKGEPSVSSLGRADTIECFSYDQQIDSTGGRRTYQPIVITKKIDKSSPLLLKSLIENAKVEANFKFFRLNKNNTTELFYSVRLKNARIVSVRQLQPDTRDKTNATPTEEVAISFNSIEWTYTEGGITTQDTTAIVSSGASGTSSPVVVGRPALRLPGSKR